MKYLLIISILLISCDGTVGPGLYCEPSQDRQEWVLTCVEKANPMSDEEPEDWTRQCAREAEKLFCKPGFSVFSGGSERTHVRPCTEAKTPDQLKVCGMGE